MMNPRSHRPVALALAALLVVPLALSVRSDGTVTAALMGVLAILLLSAWGGRSWLDRRRQRQVEQQHDPS
jgi:membrane protein implicated in regulation of membrane protease activity